jgi:hypothetical protein
LSDIDDDDSSSCTAYLNVSTVDNSVSNKVEVDEVVDWSTKDEVADWFKLSSPSEPKALWLELKELKLGDGSLWCDSDSLDLIIF